MNNLKSQFPIFQYHSNLVYLDTAATSQTPQVVLDQMNEYYTKYRSNSHRGLYDLSVVATKEYELVRQKVADFIGASAPEIVFTSGTTASLNLLAESLKKNLQPGDNIVLTRYEHHANLLPWQKIAQESGATVRFLEMDFQMEDIDGDEKVFQIIKGNPPVPKSSGTFQIKGDSIEKCIDERTKIVSFGLVSNVLGMIVSTNQIIARAKKFGAITIIDAAQAVAHVPVNAKQIDCDFLVFSAHKMYGPTGVGVLYGKKECFAKLDPFFRGGEMVEGVTYDSATWAEAPLKFEAGTPNIAGVLGLGAALDFLAATIGWDDVQKHESALTSLLLSELETIPQVQIVGPATIDNRIGLVSFVVEGVHPHDVAEILNRDQICVRAGHHCAMPLMHYMGLPGTVRVSFGAYNTEQDVDRLIKGLRKVISVFYP